MKKSIVIVITIASFLLGGLGSYFIFSKSNEEDIKALKALPKQEKSEGLRGVYDIDKNIKVMNITPDAGPDIKFYDYNDTIYTLHDNNTDNKINDSYDMYLKANYSLSDYLKWEYSTEFLGKKIDYDFMSNYVYVKDNILYSKNYGNEKYPTTEKVSGNYEGKKVIRIYNERIVKTDKTFYELMNYFDPDLNKTVITTVKINMLTKYYDEVLTFTLFPAIKEAIISFNSPLS